MKSGLMHPSGFSRRRLGVAMLAAGLLVGCGFKLRGSQNFAFTSIAIGPNPGGAVVQELRRSFGGAVRVLGVDEPPTHSHSHLRAHTQGGHTAQDGDVASQAGARRKGRLHHSLCYRPGAEVDH